MNLRSPLSRVRGLGSAKEGSHHWWIQRVTSVALVPLVLWFVYGVVAMTQAGYEGALLWLGNPINTALAVIFLFVTFYHATLGMEEILVDYVGSESFKVATVMITKFALVFLGAVSIIAVLRIAFGG